MGGYVNNATVFLVDTLFGLYILVVLVRFLLQWLRADFYNPVSQFIITVTNPPVRFLRRFIPGFRGFDLASLLLALVLSMVKTWLLFSMKGAGHLADPGVHLPVPDPDADRAADPGLRHRPEPVSNRR